LLPDPQAKPANDSKQRPDLAELTH